MEGNFWFFFGAVGHLIFFRGDFLNFLREIIDGFNLEEIILFLELFWCLFIIIIILANSEKSIKFNNG